MKHTMLFPKKNIFSFWEERRVFIGDNDTGWLEAEPEKKPEEDLAQQRAQLADRVKSDTTPAFDPGTIQLYSLQNRPKEQVQESPVPSSDSLSALSRKNLSAEKPWASRSPSQTITLIQNILKEKGFYNGRIDGQYGADTKAAVRLLQRSLGVSADGNFGNATLKALQEKSKVSSSPLVSPPQRREDPNEQVRQSFEGSEWKTKNYPLPKSLQKFLSGDMNWADFLGTARTVTTRLDNIDGGRIGQGLLSQLSRINGRGIFGRLGENDRQSWNYDFLKGRLEKSGSGSRPTEISTGGFNDSGFPYSAPPTAEKQSAPAVSDEQIKEILLLVELLRKYEEQDAVLQQQREAIQKKLGDHAVVSPASGRLDETGLNLKSKDPIKGFLGEEAGDIQTDAQGNVRVRVYGKGKGVEEMVFQPSESAKIKEIMDKGLAVENDSARIVKIGNKFYQLPVADSPPELKNVGMNQATDWHLPMSYLKTAGFDAYQGFTQDVAALGMRTFLERMPQEQIPQFFAMTKSGEIFLKEGNATFSEFLKTLPGTLQNQMRTPNFGEGEQSAMMLEGERAEVVDRMMKAMRKNADPATLAALMGNTTLDVDIRGAVQEKKGFLDSRLEPQSRDSVVAEGMKTDIWGITDAEITGALDMLVKSANFKNPDLEKLEKQLMEMGKRALDPKGADITGEYGQQIQKMKNELDQYPKTDPHREGVMKRAGAALALANARTTLGNNADLASALRLLAKGGAPRSAAETRQLLQARSAIDTAQSVQYSFDALGKTGILKEIADSLQTTANPLLALRGGVTGLERGNLTVPEPIVRKISEKNEQGYFYGDALSTIDLKPYMGTINENTTEIGGIPVTVTRNDDGSYNIVQSGGGWHYTGPVVGPETLNSFKQGAENIIQTQIPGYNITINTATLEALAAQGVPTSGTGGVTIPEGAIQVTGLGNSPNVKETIVCKPDGTKVITITSTAGGDILATVTLDKERGVVVMTKTTTGYEVTRFYKNKPKKEGHLFVDASTNTLSFQPTPDISLGVAGGVSADLANPNRDNISFRVGANGNMRLSENLSLSGAVGSSISLAGKDVASASAAVNAQFEQGSISVGVRGQALDAFNKMRVSGAYASGRLQIDTQDLVANVGVAKDSISASLSIEKNATHYQKKLEEIFDKLTDQDVDAYTRHLYGNNLNPANLENHRQNSRLLLASFILGDSLKGSFKALGLTADATPGSLTVGAFVDIVLGSTVVKNISASRNIQNDAFRSSLLALGNDASALRIRKNFPENEVALGSRPASFLAPHGNDVPKDAQYFKPFPDNYLSQLYSGRAGGDNSGQVQVQVFVSPEYRDSVAVSPDGSYAVFGSLKPRPNILETSTVDGHKIVKVYFGNNVRAAEFGSGTAYESQWMRQGQKPVLRSKESGAQSAVESRESLVGQGTRLFKQAMTELYQSNKMPRQFSAKGFEYSNIRDGKQVLQEIEKTLQVTGGNPVNLVKDFPWVRDFQKQFGLSDQDLLSQIILVRMGEDWKGKGYDQMESRNPRKYTQEIAARSQYFEQNRNKVLIPRLTEFFRGQGMSPAEIQTQVLSQLRLPDASTKTEIPVRGGLGYVFAKGGKIDTLTDFSGSTLLHAKQFSVSANGKNWTITLGYLEECRNPTMLVEASHLGATPDREDSDTKLGLELNILRIGFSANFVKPTISSTTDYFETVDYERKEGKEKGEDTFDIGGEWDGEKKEVTEIPPPPPTETPPTETPPTETPPTETPPTETPPTETPPTETPPTETPPTETPPTKTPPTETPPTETPPTKTPPTETPPTKTPPTDPPTEPTRPPETPPTETPPTETPPTETPPTKTPPTDPPTEPTRPN